MRDRVLGVWQLKYAEIDPNLATPPLRGYV
jgi:hypothetical protein